MNKNSNFMSKFKKLVLCFCTICFCGFALAETVNWYLGDDIYTTTSCEIGNDITLPTTPQKKGYTFIGWRERTNRGTFSTWATVPTDVNLYNVDSNGSTTPMAGDYMVVNNSSDYVSVFDKVIHLTFNVWDVSWTYESTTNTFNTESVGTEHFAGPTDELIVIRRHANANIHIIANKTVKYDNVIYTTNETFVLFDATRQCRSEGYDVFFGDPSITGTWRFMYEGDWATDGRAGWKPVAQIE